MKDIKIKMALPVRILDESSEFARMVNECAEYRKTHGNPTSIIKYEYMDDDKKWIGYKWYNFTLWVQNEKKIKSKNFKKYVDDMFWFYTENGEPYLEDFEWDYYYKGYWLKCYWENGKHQKIWWG